jgi:hypothetical protein
MQLTREAAVQRRSRLRRAALALLAVSATPAGVQAAEGGAPGWHLQGATLLYAEAKRTTVFEPVASAQRTFRNGHSVNVQFVFDAMTGASPNGAMPSGATQTFTTPSGNRQTTHNGEVPLRTFHDERVSVDGSYDLPVSRLVSLSAGGHASAETDYKSTGVKLSGSVDGPDRLNTFEIGGSTNADRVEPKAGRPDPLTFTSNTPTKGSAAKRTWSVLAGYTRILSRRWMMKLNYSREVDSGYLTEPYKEISVVDGRTGETLSYRWEGRPDSRLRQAVLLSSVYQHEDADVIYSEGRFYWDDWGIRSETVDLKWRHDVEETQYIEPHVRFYHQSAVDFFSYGLIDRAPLPQYATSDYRFATMNTITVGAKYGFKVEGTGDFDIRLEYIRQSGDGHPSDAVGLQKDINLLPAVDIITVGFGVAIDR